jgi:heptosyltransferase-1
MSSGESNPVRVLIVRIGAMGDVLHGMPAVAGLRAALAAELPGCVIGWAVEPRWAPLLQTGAGVAGPLVDRVHLVKTKEWKRRPFATETVREIAALRRGLRAEQYDVCVDVQGSIKSGVIGWMAGAKRFVGPDAPRERQARLLYGERVTVAAPNVIGQACELVGDAIGRPVSGGRVELPVDVAAEAWANEALLRLAEKDAVRPLESGGSSFQGAARGFVLIAPTAGWGAKEWGAERYGALAKGLMDAGFRVLMNKLPGSLLSMEDEVARISGASALYSTLPQMIALTRRAALVVGGDTGPVHLAAALGRPVVALFGPTDPARNGPDFPGARVRVLRDAGSVTSHKRLAETEAGLAKVRVEEVLAAALAMLGERTGEWNG